MCSVKNKFYENSSTKTYITQASFLPNIRKVEKKISAMSGSQPSPLHREKINKFCKN